MEILIIHKPFLGSREVPHKFGPDQFSRFDVYWTQTDAQSKYINIDIKKFIFAYTGCPKKHGNSVTNSISSLLWISIVIPNFKSNNIIMSARVYFMKRLKDCKDVYIMSPQDEHKNRMQSKHKQTKCEHSRRNSYRLQLS